MANWNVPAARADVSVAEAPDGGGVMVLEGRCGVSHHLDCAAAAVWRACDGARDRIAIARLTGLSPLQVAVIVDRLVSLGLTERFTVNRAEVVDLASRREQPVETARAADVGSRSLRLV